MELLLLSNSTNHGSVPLAHAQTEIRDFLQERRVLFVPYALADHDAYTAKITEAFEPVGSAVTGIHTASDPIQAVADAEAVYVGGGNSFRLLRRLQAEGLLGPLRERVATSLRYMGASAGTNLACPTIRTTNDMPIVEPDDLTALGLIKIQLNPHYVDPEPGNTHMGETREKRLAEFHEENEVPVLGIREGGWLRVRSDRTELRGATARLFRRGEPATEIEVDSDLTDLVMGSSG